MRQSSRGSAVTRTSPCELFPALLPLAVAARAAFAGLILALASALSVVPTAASEAAGPAGQTSAGSPRASPAKAPEL